MTDKTAVAESPPTDTAVTVTVVMPDFNRTDGMLHRDVPCATPLSPRSVFHLTSAIPLACVAVPDMPIAALVVVNWAALVGDRIRTTGGACSSGLEAGASVRRSLALLDVAVLVTGANGITGGGIDTLARGSGGCVTGAGCGSTTAGTGAAVEF